ncbi:MAG: hypothetical protein IJ506_06030 [Clostridia bacterium]|nr:hypothetical protein [Clostridia bacterium]
MNNIDKKKYAKLLIKLNEFEQTDVLTGSSEQFDVNWLAFKEGGND